MPNCPDTPEGGKETELNLSSNNVKLIHLIDKFGHTQPKMERLQKKEDKYRLVVKKSPVFVGEEF